MGALGRRCWRPVSRTVTRNATRVQKYVSREYAAAVDGCVAAGAVCRGATGAERTRDAWGFRRRGFGVRRQ